MMGILDRLLNPVEQRNSLSLTNYAQWVEAGIVNASASGVNVTHSKALTYAAVFACVRVLAETVASLPLITYERMNKGKRRATDFYLYPLLHDAPNPRQTAYNYRLTLMGHLALWGNAYSEIIYNGRGQVTELWPLNPAMMERIVTDADGGKVYEYRLSSGELQRIPGFKVWHLSTLGDDGTMGYSMIRLHRQGIGLGLATEEFGARFFGNDARPGGILSHPGILGDEAAKRLRESWESAHGGLSKSHRVAILEEGLQYQQIGIPPEDAQFLETRVFQKREIASIYRVPPHMIGDLERATFSNIEQQSIEFISYTMLPWFTNWEQSIQLNLMLQRERKKYFVEFLTAALERGDIQTRYQAYGMGRQWGWLSANDVREYENLNPIEGGDEYMMPLNMVPAGDAEEGMRNEEGGVRNSNFEIRKTEGEERRIGNVMATRLRLRAAYRQLVEEAMGRVFRREANDVANAARRFQKANDLSGFRLWLQEFYQEHQQFSTKQVRPVMDSYAGQIGMAAADEVGSEAMPEEVGRFAGRYAEAWASRAAFRSMNQVETALEDEDREGALDLLFDRWRNERPETTAGEETVRIGDAVASFVYLLAGRQVLRWVAVGKNCPYCSNLDGKIVGIQEYFIGQGEDYQPEGAETPLRPTSNIGHAPAHKGCDCMVMAG